MGACCSTTPRASTPDGFYHARVTKVINGDTVELAIRIYWDAPMMLYRARLFGINAPEIHPAGLNKETSKLDTPEVRALKKEKEKGVVAKMYLERLMRDYGPGVGIHTKGNDKYGRLLVDVYANNIFNFRRDAVNINKMMVDGGHAVSYDGGKR